jgi:TonB family protein
MNSFIYTLTVSRIPFANRRLRMKWVILVLVFATSTLGQTTLPRVSSEEAVKHLVSSSPPVYPPLAQQTRISGDVLLEIVVTADGKTSLRHVISGHPLLIQAAIDAVQTWRFQPFIVDGNPAAVVTAVIVPIGNAANQTAADQVELRFQYDFWTTESLARGALAKGDFSGAEAQLRKAQEFLAAFSGEGRNNPERLQYFMDSGDLSRAQQKFDEAEQNYRKGLELAQKGNPEGPDVAAVLARLASLYAQEKRYELARDNFSHSITIYRKILKRIGSNNPGARQVYGAAIANESWMLSEIERTTNNQTEVVNQCRTVVEFQEFLGAADRDSILSGCQKAIADSH